MKCEVEAGCVNVIASDTYGVSVSVHLPTNKHTIEGDSVQSKGEGHTTRWIGIRDEEGGEVTIFVTPDNIRAIMAACAKLLPEG